MTDITSTQATKQAATHPAWYAIGMLSAFIMGLSAFVIAYNFMLGQAPLLLVITCATAGLLLNTTLYWIDSAQKLESFFAAVWRAPESLLNKNALINFSSAVCVGFLALYAYMEQAQSFIPSAWQQVIPIWPLITLLSMANAISTFVLFYEEEDTNAPAAPLTIKSLITWAQQQLQTPRKTQLANLIGISQSLMFSLTNLWCVQSVIHMLAPQLSVVSLVISVPMSLALLYSECKFNCDKMQSIMENDATQYWAYPALQSTLYALVWLNGFANGWIALGDLHHLPIITQWLVVAIGSTVSFAVMKSNLKEINKIIFNPTENQHRLIPIEAKDQAALVEVFSKTGMMIFGAYIIAYPIVLQQLLTIPMIAYPLLAGFVFTSATCTMDGVAWIRNQIENSHYFTWSTSNEQHLKADSLNNSKPEESNTQEQTVYERVHTLFSKLYQNYGLNNAPQV